MVSGFSTIAFLSLILCWILYPFALFIFSYMRKKNEFIVDEIENEVVAEKEVEITILIAVHNEERNIIKRLDNISRTVSPYSSCEVLVVCDNCTDSTLELVSGAQFDNIHLRAIEVDNDKRGRANAHNLSVKKCAGDIIIFTDAETAFLDNFDLLYKNAFSNDDVGFVCGKLEFLNDSQEQHTIELKKYWQWETQIREAESQLGVFFQGTGANCAVKKNLFEQLPLIGDVDFITPLDVLFANKKCVFRSDIVASDYAPRSESAEYNARVRMTSKNARGYFEVLKKNLRRYGLTKKLLFLVAILITRKYIRWLSPVLLLVILVEYFIMNFYFVLALLIAFCLFLVAFRSVRRISRSSLIIATAFTLGLIRAAFLNVPEFYDNGEG